MSSSPWRGKERNMHRTSVIGIAAVGVGMVVGCGSGDDSGYGGGGGGGSGSACTSATATATTAVSAQDSRFSPACIKVNAGQTVTWTNTGAIPHTVTSEAGAPASFDSGSMDQGEAFSQAFTTKGTYDYRCSFHFSSGMIGTVIVE